MSTSSFYVIIDTVRGDLTMKKAGLIAAVEIEAVKQQYGTPLKQLKTAGFDIYVYQKNDVELYVLRSGPGEIAAASAAQLLITGFQVDVLLNFGVVGGLTEEMNDVRVCVVEKVVHYQFDTSEVDHCETGLYLNEFPSIYMPCTEELIHKALEVEPSLKKVTCASADKFVASAEEKNMIHEKFKADICEMEAAGIVKTALKNGVPCLLLKMVADSVNGGAEEYFSAFASSSAQCFAVMDRIISTL